MRAFLVVVTVLLAGCGGGEPGGSDPAPDAGPVVDAGAHDSGPVLHAEWEARELCQDRSVAGKTTTIWEITDAYAVKHPAEWITIRSVFDNDVSTEETVTINNPQIDPVLRWSRPTTMDWQEIDVWVTTSGATSVKHSESQPSWGYTCQ